jgi:hypothetical protein
VVSKTYTTALPCSRPGKSRQNPPTPAPARSDGLPVPAPSLPLRIGLAVVVVVAAAVGLASTNPGPDAFEEFAGDQLTRLLTEELCEPDGLPMVLRLVIRDCPGMVHAQRRVLGRVALEHTRRRNLGVASLYRTDLGGQELLGSLRLPRYQAMTLAAAGQFVLLRTDTLKDEQR